MSNLIVSNLKDVTMSSQFIMFKTDNSNIVIDIRKLLKGEGDEVYFNITHIAQHYGKNISKFFKNKSTREYMDALDELLIENQNSKSKIKLKYTKRGRETAENKGTFGTYLYKDLAIMFFRWLDIRFAVMCDQFLKQVISQCDIIKIESGNNKIHFRELIDAIKDIYIPAQTSENARKYAYPSIANLINLKILGTTATNYAIENNIQIENNKTIRDYISKDKVEKIDYLEKKLWGYIDCANITDYDTLKNKVMDLTL